MLTMAQVHDIRKLYFEEGRSISQISRDTGFDRKTVRSYINKDDWNAEIPVVADKTEFPKLEPYKSIITEWLEKDKKAKRKQRHTALRVYNRLTEEIAGFNCSYRTVAAYVAKKKKEIFRKEEGFLPLEHPGGEAQVDFGDADFYENGITYDGYYLNMSYPYSNGGHMQLFKSANQECLLEGMKAIFEHIGGVPTAIWFDNMSTAVKKVKEYGERDLTKGFLRFMMHYGFQSNFCNPNSGHEKGSVENKVGYHRRNMLVPIPEFKDLKEYNKELLLKCDQDMNRMHYKGYGMIKDLFQEDKQEFFKLPKVSFEVYLHEFVKADNYGKVKFDGRTYSTSPGMAGRQVMVKAGAYDIEILDEDCNYIIKHRRLYGEEKESMNWIPYLELMSRRPTALKYTGLYNQLPQILKEYLDQSDYEGKKQALKLFTKMTVATGFNTAIEAFEEGLRLGVSDPDSIWATYCRLTTGTLPEPEVPLPDTVPELKKYTPDFKVYDELIVSGGLQQ